MSAAKNSWKARVASEYVRLRSSFGDEPDSDNDGGVSFAQQSAQRMAAPGALSVEARAAHVVRTLESAGSCKHTPDMEQLELTLAQMWHEIERIAATEQREGSDEHGGVVEIDGAILEGGGQIIRQSVALSTLTHTTIKLVRIRAGRSKPGLRAQHKAGIDLVAVMSGGRAEGSEVMSQEMVYTPAPATATWSETSLVGDAHGGGSVALMAQIALPVLCFARLQPSDEGSVVNLRLIGGTNAGFSPQIEFTQHVLVPTLRRLCGMDLNVSLIARGGSWGGGEVALSITPKPRVTLPPIILLDRGEVTRIVVRVWVNGAYADTVRDFAGMAMTAVVDRVSRALGRPVQRSDAPPAPPSSGGGALPLPVECIVEPALPLRTTGGQRVWNGAGILIIAETASGCLIAGSSLITRNISGKSRGGKRGKKRKGRGGGGGGGGGDRAAAAAAAAKAGAEEGARFATKMLTKELAHGGCVDEYLQDQLIVFMALAGGTSRMRCGPLSLHTKTAIHFAQLLTDAKFRVTPVAGAAEGGAGGDSGAVIVECDGCCFV